jgi:hypothetical protein
MANEPWETRGRSKYIGLPICARIVPDTPPLDGDSSSSSSFSDEERWFTTPSYFASALGGHPGGIDLSIGGTFTATVTLQRSFDDGATWNDVEAFTDPTQKTVEYPNRGVKLRLGVKSGEYTSGAIELRLSQAG